MEHKKQTSSLIELSSSTLDAVFDKYGTTNALVYQVLFS